MFINGINACWFCISQPGPKLSQYFHVRAARVNCDNHHLYVCLSQVTWIDQIGEPEVPLCWVLPLPNSIFLQVNKDYLKLVTLTKRVTSVAGISGIANMLVEKIRRKAYLQKSHFIPLNQQNVSAFVCHPLSSSTLGQLLPSC